MADYRVEVWDNPELQGRALSETPARDWPHCLDVVRTLAREHRTKTVAAYNADACDCDDGLTDGEREQMFAAVEEARRG